jgi:hypothetical protein
MGALVVGRFVVPLGVDVLREVAKGSEVSSRRAQGALEHGWWGGLGHVFFVFGCGDDLAEFGEVQPRGGWLERGHAWRTAGTVRRGGARFDVAWQDAVDVEGANRRSGVGGHIETCREVRGRAVAVG